MALSDHIRLGRYLPLFKVACLLALLVGALDVLARRAFIPDDAVVPPRVLWEHLNLAGQRVAGIEEAILNKTLDERNLVIVFGASTVRLDLDASALRAGDPGHRDWVVIGTAGFDLGQLEPSSWPLVRSTASPPTVVLGLHPAMLGFSASAMDSPQSGELPAISFLTRHSLLAVNRYRWRSSVLPLEVFEQRTRLSSYLHQGARSYFAPSDNLLQMWEWEIVKDAPTRTIPTWKASDPASGGSPTTGTSISPRRIPMF